MKKIVVLAALLMATTAAHAGNSASFQIDGHRVRIEVPNNCSSLSCIQVSAPGLSGSSFGGFKGFKSRNTDDDDVADRTDPPATVAAPVAATPQPVAPAPVAAVVPAAPTTVATAAPVPAVGFDKPAAAPAAPAPAPVAAAAPAPTTPLGVWATEENKGDVRIEQCGQNLCGYSVKTNAKVLINMKAADTKWTGQIRDPDSGNNYDSTIAMKGPNTLRVQGCAMGGMFCGGQTWKRIS